MLELQSATETIVEVCTSATREALHNWQRNCAALNRLLDFAQPKVEWLFGRDGALTAQHDGKWWGSCSVPAKAAEQLLGTLNITCPVACFICPAHPAQIAFALKKLQPEQAVIALFERAEDWILTLHCHDFSADIAAHRLWFVAGEDWARQMTELFVAHPGLPLPQQFIRTALLPDDVSSPLIATAQKIFTEELNRRSVLLSELRQRRYGTKAKLITLAARMGFRLWDDAGGILRQLTGSGFELNCTNFDDPAQASPLALAQAAAESDAIVTANLTRADCAHFLHPQIPLISWLTNRPIPPFDSACSRDSLLLPDKRLLEAAKKSGWPANRLFHLPWPSTGFSTSSKTLAIIADTRPIDASGGFDLSSHQLLWDLILAELQKPFAITDVNAYLHSRMQRLNITDHGLDVRRFIDALIIPAYQQSIAAQLLNAELPVKLSGHGWRDIPAFAAYATGPIASREQLTAAVGQSGALIHVWPSDHPHPIDTAGPAVLRLTARGLSGLLSDARLALEGKMVKPRSPAADAFDMPSFAHMVRAALAK